LISKPS